MTAQNTKGWEYALTMRTASLEEGLLVGHTIAMLQWVITSRGEPQHIENLPGCFNSKLWAHNQKLFTAVTVSRTTFRFYVTPEGARFLQKSGIEVKSGVEVRPFAPEYSDPSPVTAVFAQDHTGSIQEVSLAEVPEYILDSLRNGMVAVADGKLYGTSPEHILGTD